MQNSITYGEARPLYSEAKDLYRSWHLACLSSLSDADEDPAPDLARSYDLAVIAFFAACFLKDCPYNRDLLESCFRTGAPLERFIESAKKEISLIP